MLTILFISILLCVLIGFLIKRKHQQVFVIEGFENPNAFKTVYLVIAFIGKIAHLISFLKLGTEYGVVQGGLNLLVKKTKINDKNFKMNTTKINGVRVRIYSMDNFKEKHAVMIYIHGGGYSFGNIDSYDLYFYEMLKRTQLTVISVDFSLTPYVGYPIPIDQCYSVASYVIDNCEEFNIDKDKVIIAGDSSGGNAAPVVCQRLIEIKNFKPKMQVLIYPWTQMFDLRLPSRIEYKSGIVASVNAAKIILWYMGFEHVDSKMQEYLLTNRHLLLIESEETRKRLKSYVSINLLPSEYKNKPYYAKYSQEDIYSSLNEPNKEFEKLENDPEFKGKIMKMFDKDMSPGLADDEFLKKMPQTYMVVFEWDALKDEQLIYIERLKKCGVSTQLAFYDNAFHGIAPVLDKDIGFKIPFRILDELTTYMNQNI